MDSRQAAPFALESFDEDDPATWFQPYDPADVSTYGQAQRFPFKRHVCTPSCRDRGFWKYRREVTHVFAVGETVWVGRERHDAGQVVKVLGNDRYEVLLFCQYHVEQPVIMVAPDPYPNEVHDR